MMYCKIVVILSMALRELSTAEYNHHLPLSFKLTTQSQEIPRPRTEEVWSNNNHVRQRAVDSHNDSLDDTPASGSLSEVRHIFLWTRKNANDSSFEDLNPDKPITIVNSSFIPRQTYVIIHGFLGWGNEPWILQLKDKLLKISDCNVVSVDWPAGTEWWLPSYYTAVGAVPYVGQDVKLLLRSLETLKSLEMKQVHFIGHSLGAHVSGFAAKHFKGEIGRITGLDPAGLTYHEVPATERLDSSDAEYVDIIHTNGCRTFWKPWTDCFGINENLGHSDFWPNGGEHQPACQKVEGEIGCDHELAYKYFIESLDYGIDSTLFLARNCSQWKEYKDGNCSCGDDAQYMGFFVNTRLAGLFYLITKSTEPFAMEDAVCSPGSASSDCIRLILKILGASVSSVVAFVGISAVGVTMYRRRSRSLGSGLLTSEEEQEEAYDEDDALVEA